MRPVRSLLPLLLVWAAALPTLVAQAPVGGILADPPEGPRPWTQLDFNNDSSRFQFAVVTDRTGGHRPGVFMEGVRRLNLIQPEFVMSVGDLIEGYTIDTVELLRQWEEFDGFVDQLEMPFFYVPGNHDITNQVMEDLWKTRYGPTYYAFTYRDVLFMCLNSEDQRRGSSRGSISDAQYDWIEATLEAHPDVKWTLVFMHQPLWQQEVDPVRWADVEQLLQGRRHTVFAGHRHRYVSYDRNNGKYIMLATTGGGSQLRGPELGEFDHVVWITMTEQGPIIANLELSGIWDEDVVTEKTRAYIDLVQSRTPFRIEPLYIEDGFTGGAAWIRVTNDADEPMRVELTDAFSFDLVSDLTQAHLEVPPNSVAFAALELRPRRPENTTGPWAPVTLHGSYAYTGEGTPKLDFPFRYHLAPETKYALKRVEGPVEVDGALGEWGELPQAPEPAGYDPADLSARFALAYDDNHLYVAAEVADDQVVADTIESLFQQDHIRFDLNAEPLRISAMRSGRGDNGASVQMLASPGGAQGQFYYASSLPEGSAWACRPTDRGYALEVALPLDYLREMQGSSWETVRFHLSVQDRDPGEEKTGRIYFQPEWRSAENRPGSGMFFRQNGRAQR